jgi:hypothetical protein
MTDTNVGDAIMIMRIMHNTRDYEVAFRHPKMKGVDRPPQIRYTRESAIWRQTGVSESKRANPKYPYVLSLA